MESETPRGHPVAAPGPRGEHTDRRLGALPVQERLISSTRLEAALRAERELRQALSAQLGVAFVNLDQMAPDRTLASRHGVRARAGARRPAARGAGRAPGGGVRGPDGPGAAGGRGGCDKLAAGRTTLEESKRVPPPAVIDPFRHLIGAEEATGVA